MQAVSCELVQSCRRRIWCIVTLSLFFFLGVLFEHHRARLNIKWTSEADSGKALQETQRIASKHDTTTGSTSLERTPKATSLKRTPKAPALQAQEPESRHARIAEYYLEHSPWWVKGRWLTDTGGKVPYDAASCKNLIGPEANLAPVEIHKGANSPLLKDPSRVTWKPTFQKDVPVEVAAPWQPLNWEELLKRNRGRSFVYVGDSLARQQFGSMRGLFLCGHKLDFGTAKTQDQTPTHISGANITIAEVRHGQFINHVLQVRASEKEPWYSYKGKKIPIYPHGENNIIFMANRTLHLALERWLPRTNVTIIFNLGHWWLRRARGDVHFIDANGEVVTDLDDKKAYFGLVVKETVLALEKKLKFGSVAIWTGFSPGKKEGDLCHDKIHPWAAEVRNSLRSARDSLGGRLRRNFFVDIGCLISSAPKTDRVWLDGSHFRVPGVPDVENFFVLRVLQDLELI